MTHQANERHVYDFDRTAAVCLNALQEPGDYRLEMVMDVHNIAAILREAREAVQEADLPRELHEVAFGRAIDMLSVQTIRGVGAAAVAPPQTAAGTHGAVDQHDPIGMIAQRLQVSRENTERVYHVEGEELKLVLPSTKLSGAMKAATREIALLVVAGRQAGGLDPETTEADRIREVAEHYRKYDSPNFSKAIKQMHDVFIVRESGRKKMLKMTQPGWEKARELVSMIVGAE